MIDAVVGDLDQITGPVPSGSEPFQGPFLFGIPHKDQPVFPVGHRGDEREVVVILLSGISDLIGGGRFDQDRGISQREGLVFLKIERGAAIPGDQGHEFIIVRTGPFISRKTDPVHCHFLQQGIRAAHVILVKVGDDQDVHMVCAGLFYGPDQLCAVILFPGIDDHGLSPAG